MLRFESGQIYTQKNQFWKTATFSPTKAIFEVGKLIDWCAQIWTYFEPLFNSILLGSVLKNCNFLCPNCLQSKGDLYDIFEGYPLNIWTLCDQILRFSRTPPNSIELKSDSKCVHIRTPRSIRFTPSYSVCWPKCYCFAKNIFWKPKVPAL